MRIQNEHNRSRKLCVVAPAIGLVYNLPVSLIIQISNQIMLHRRSRSSVAAIHCQNRVPHGSQHFISNGNCCQAFHLAAAATAVVVCCLPPANAGPWAATASTPVSTLCVVSRMRASNSCFGRIARHENHATHENCVSVVWRCATYTYTPRTRTVSCVSCVYAPKKIDDRHGNLYKYI